MALDGREKVFAAVGLLGLVIGVVALVVAITAKNGNTSDSEVEQQVKAELSQSIDEVRGTVSSEQGNARRAQRKTEGSITTNASDIAKLAKKNKQLKGDVASSQDQITKLEDEIRKLTNQVSTLTDEQDSTQDKLRQLTDRVEDLSARKKNR